MTDDPLLRELRKERPSAHAVLRFAHFNPDEPRDPLTGKWMRIGSLLRSLVKTDGTAAEAARPAPRKLVKEFGDSTSAKDFRRGDHVQIDMSMYHQRPMEGTVTGRSHSGLSVLVRTINGEEPAAYGPSDLRHQPGWEPPVPKPRTPKPPPVTKRYVVHFGDSKDPLDFFPNDYVEYTGTLADSHPVETWRVLPQVDVNRTGPYGGLVKQIGTGRAEQFEPGDPVVNGGLHPFIVTGPAKDAEHVMVRRLWTQGDEEPPYPYPVSELRHATETGDIGPGYDPVPLSPGKVAITKGGQVKWAWPEDLRSVVPDSARKVTEFGKGEDWNFKVQDRVEFRNAFGGANRGTGTVIKAAPPGLGGAVTVDVDGGGGTVYVQPKDLINTDVKAPAPVRAAGEREVDDLTHFNATDRPLIAAQIERMAEKHPEAAKAIRVGTQTQTDNVYAVTQYGWVPPPPDPGNGAATIFFNPLWAGTHFQFDAQLQEDFKSRFHPTSPVADVLTHEWGHALCDYAFRGDDNAELKLALDALGVTTRPGEAASWRQEVLQRKLAPMSGTEISRYAQTNVHEFIAECYAWANEPDPAKRANWVDGALAQRVADALDKAVSDKEEAGLREVAAKAVKPLPEGLHKGQVVTLKPEWISTFKGQHVTIVGWDPNPNPDPKLYPGDWIEVKDKAGETNYITEDMIVGRGGTGAVTRSVPSTGPISPELAAKIQGALTNELRGKRYQGNPNPLAGHCYVASEAAYHLLGGKAAGLTPMNMHWEGESHWYLQDKGGNVIDLTAGQFKTPPDYSLGKGKGFLTKQPSKRAQTVIDRVAGVGTPSGRDPRSDQLPDSFATLSTWKKVSGPSGSQPGQWYHSPSGTNVYVKPTDAAHAHNEVGAMAAYQAAGLQPGVDFPRTKVLTSGGRSYVVSQEVPGLVSEDESWWEGHPEAQQAAAKFLAVNALTAHYDAAGGAMDNLLVDGNGQPVLVETGGAMAYRARGQAKATWNTSASLMDEVRSVTGRNPDYPNYQMQAVWGSVSPQEVSGALLALASDPSFLARLEALWGAQGMPDAQLQKNLAVIQSRLAQIPAVADQLQRSQAAALAETHWRAAQHEAQRVLPDATLVAAHRALAADLVVLAQRDPDPEVALHAELTRTAPRAWLVADLLLAHFDPKEPRDPLTGKWMRIGGLLSQVEHAAKREKPAAVDFSPGNKASDFKKGDKIEMEYQGRVLSGTVRDVDEKGMVYDPGTVIAALDNPPPSSNGIANAPASQVRHVLSLPDRKVTEVGSGEDWNFKIGDRVQYQSNVMQPDGSYKLSSGTGTVSRLPVHTASNDDPFFAIDSDEGGRVSYSARQLIHSDTADPGLNVRPGEREVDDLNRLATEDREPVAQRITELAALHPEAAKFIRVGTSRRTFSDLMQGGAGSSDVYAVTDSIWLVPPPPPPGIVPGDRSQHAATIGMNPDIFSDHQLVTENMQNDYEAKFHPFSAGAENILTHEWAHALADYAFADDNKAQLKLVTDALGDDPWTPPHNLTASQIAQKIGRYGSHSPAEFIAECYAYVHADPGVKAEWVDEAMAERIAVGLDAAVSAREQASMAEALRFAGFNPKELRDPLTGKWVTGGVLGKVEKAIAGAATTKAAPKPRAPRRVTDYGLGTAASFRPGDRVEWMNDFRGGVSRGTVLSKSKGLVEVRMEGEDDDITMQRTPSALRHVPEGVPERPRAVDFGDTDASHFKVGDQVEVRSTAGIKALGSREIARPGRVTGLGPAQDKWGPLPPTKRKLKVTYANGREETVFPADTRLVLPLEQRRVTAEGEGQEWNFRPGDRVAFKDTPPGKYGYANRVTMTGTVIGGPKKRGILPVAHDGQDEVRSYHPDSLVHTDVPKPAPASAPGERPEDDLTGLAPEDREAMGARIADVAALHPTASKHIEVDGTTRGFTEVMSTPDVPEDYNADATLGRTSPCPPPPGRVVIGLNPRFYSADGEEHGQLAAMNQKDFESQFHVTPVSDDTVVHEWGHALCCYAFNITDYSGGEDPSGEQRALVQKALEGVKVKAVIGGSKVGLGAAPGDYVDTLALIKAQSGTPLISRYGMSSVGEFIAECYEAARAPASSQRGSWINMDAANAVADALDKAVAEKEAAEAAGDVSSLGTPVAG